MVNNNTIVCSKENSIDLYKAGITQRSTYYWVGNDLVSYADLAFLEPYTRAYSAFTIIEMGEMLPSNIDGFSFSIIKNKINWIAMYNSKSKDESLYPNEQANLADAIAKVLICAAIDQRLDRSSYLAA